MEIKVMIETTIEIKDGEPNINEILWAIGNWSRKVGIDVSKGVIETYQREIIKMLCGRGESASWVNHEHNGIPGQMCLGGNYRSGGTRSKERILRTDIGVLHLKMQQLICGVCGKR
ncbi:MAG: hypothetical protein QME68_06405, partial [Elusimicrobiota bacterium]|nr:hypothetical protein [Elusimicrobiota bacterium]